MTLHELRCKVFPPDRWLNFVGALEIIILFTIYAIGEVSK